MREISNLEMVCINVGGFFLELAMAGYVLLGIVALCRVLGLYS